MFRSLQGQKGMTLNAELLDYASSTIKDNCELNFEVISRIDLRL
jgi:hypothetical protein